MLHTSISGTMRDALSSSAYWNPQVHILAPNVLPRSQLRGESHSMHQRLQALEPGFTVEGK